MNKLQVLRIRCGVLIKYVFYTMMFYCCRILPLRDKIVATSFKGRKYGDNPGYIIDEILKRRPGTDIVWLKKQDYEYSVPDGVRTVGYTDQLKMIYEYATARVWINSHRLEGYIRKRKHQIFIETWHGGLGFKKIEADLEAVRNTRWETEELKTTSGLADVFISNSDWLSDLYRRAFWYKGDIYKCGFPRNDILLTDNREIKKRVCEKLNISDVNIAMYAPTFRDSFQKTGVIDMSVYDIDPGSLYSAVKERFGGEWVILLRWHPILVNKIDSSAVSDPHVIDVTKYPDMQELMMCADMFVTDYSSGIFDAALRGIPCFVYAKDFEQYKSDRGVYFELDELPFPHAKDNAELKELVLAFDEKEYAERWQEFSRSVGLNETGHAARDIADKIIGFLDNNKVDWRN